MNCPCGNEHVIIDTYRRALARQTYDEMIMVGDCGELWLCDAN